VRVGGMPAIGDSDDEFVKCGPRIVTVLFLLRGL